MRETLPIYTIRRWAKVNKVINLLSGIIDQQVLQETITNRQVGTSLQDFFIPSPNKQKTIKQKNSLVEAFIIKHSYKDTNKISEELDYS